MTLDYQDQFYCPGDLVAGRYRIEGLLGEGGMGSVYEATQIQLDRPIALKVLLPHFGIQADARQRFEREARVAATLRHPNAVTIYDFGDDDGRLYLAMERLGGQTLRESLKGSRYCGIDLTMVLEVGAQICDVLVVAHRLGLVHRDLKPENIFLEPVAGGFRVVVVDFGLAFIENVEGVGRMTREGIITGTPEYMSPEQARARSVGPPADIYALGCVLYELIAGNVPFQGESHFETVSQQVYAPPRPIHELCPDMTVPVVVEALVSEMLAKRTSDRPTAVDAAERLRDLQGGFGQRERGKDEKQLETRASRMIPKPRISDVADTLPPVEGAVDDVAMRLVGEISDDLRQSLAVNGVRVLTADCEEGSIIFAPSATIDEIESIDRRGLPLLTDAIPADMERLTELLAAGVDEVVARPLHAEELARKVWRAIRKKNRTRQELR